MPLPSQTANTISTETIQAEPTYTLTIEPTLTNAPLTITPTQTPSSTSSIPLASITQDAHCRLGPSTMYAVMTSLTEGTTVQIDGHNKDSSWWYIRLSNSNAHCWIWSGLAETTGDVSGLHYVPSPPLQQQSEIPVQACWVFMPNLKKNVCVAPCPGNAQPGGACTP